MVAPCATSPFATEALALKPSVLVADELTTTLRVTTLLQILKLIRGLQRRRGMNVLFSSPTTCAWPPRPATGLP